MMKVCVYSIAKNEQEQIQRWYDSAKDADAIVLGDTGSNDNTVELSRSLGIDTYQLNLNEFTFDKAKNQLLNHIDADIYVNLDLDELLIDNWRTHIEQMWPFDILQVGYYRPNGERKNVRKIHSKRCVWKSCIHEFLYCDNPIIKNRIHTLFSHQPNLSKDRSNYFDLLKHSVYNENYRENRGFNLYQYALMLKDKKMYGEAFTILQAAAYECSINSPSNLKRVQQLMSEVENEY